MRGIDEIAIAFDKACRQAEVKYAFMGAMAVMAWGEPRATQDVDTLLVISNRTVPSFVAALQQVGLRASAQDLLSAFEDRSHVTVDAEDSVFYIDAKLALTPTERQQVEEASEVPFRTASLRVVRPEETIAFKLSFGSPKDIQDVRSILLRTGGRLDRARLTQFALRLGVQDKLRDVEAHLERP